MAAPNKPDHWGSLASELGADLPGKKTKETPATPAAAPPESAPKAAAKKPAKPVASAEPAGGAKTDQPSGWDALASELGVAVPVETAKTTPKSRRSSRPQVSNKRAAPGTKKRPAPPEKPSAFSEKSSGIAEERPSGEDARVSVEERPFGVIDEPREVSEKEKSDLETPVEESKRSKTTRRRKRRRKPTVSAESATEGVAPEKPGSAPSESESTGPATDESDEAATGAKVSELTVPEGEGSEADGDKANGGRLKRRRKRRGSSRKKKQKEGETVEVASAEQTAVKESEQPSAVTKASADGVETPDSAAQIEKSTKEAKPAKPSHRGIPTWEEAIGLIVTRNLDTRSKKNGGSSRGRSGGRGSSKARTSPKEQSSGKSRASRSRSAKKRS